MAEPALAPRNAFVGVIALWVLGLLAAVAIGVFIPEPERVEWLLVAFGGGVLLSFAVQLAYGQTRGFIFRVAAGVLGLLIILGAVSTAFGLAALIPA